MLLDMVPVDRLDGTALAGDERLAYMAGSFAALLMGERIFILEDVLGLQAGIFLVALIAQEQRLAATNALIVE